MFAEPVAAAEFETIDGVSDLVVEAEVLHCRLTGEADPLIKAAARQQVIDFISEEPDLETLFFHYYIGEETHAG
jgi:ABC-2 type transport system ATP-binding protein